MNNFLETFVQQVISATPPIPFALTPAENDQPITYNLSTGNPTQRNLAKLSNELMTLDEARIFMQQQLQSYFYSYESGALLLKTFPGVGKSTAAITFAQQLAEDGYRVLYLMPRHDYWWDIQNNKKTHPELWYHWVATTGTTENGDPMCRYSDTTQQWMKKGYPLIDACKSLCGSSYMKICPYRSQAKITIPIIAGVHQHLTTGLSIDNFDCVIIDELPISAFLRTRVIPIAQIDVGGFGDVKKLFNRLTSLCQTACQTAESSKIKGKSLLDEIGELLETIYANTKMGGDWLPVKPVIENEGDVEAVKAWYFFDMLLLLLPEFEAWKRGEADWLSRVFLTDKGLHLLSKAKLWEHLPNKVVALDATGEQLIYEKLLNMSVRVVNPLIKRIGKFYQITQRTNGISMIADRSQLEAKLTSQGEDLLLLAKMISENNPKTNQPYRNAGVITFKAIRHLFESPFNGNVAHFGGNRGSNDFEHADVDCLIIAGCPSPPDNDLIDLAAQLSVDHENPANSRIEPFSALTTNGRLVPVRSTKLAEYHILKADGQSLFRPISGFWNHPELHAILEMFREAELEQAAGRGRSYIKDCDVWILTAVPLQVMVDAVVEKPYELLNMPNLPLKKWAEISAILPTKDFWSAQELAESLKISKPIAIKYCRQISEWQPDVWIYGSDPENIHRGRPSKGLLKNTTELWNEMESTTPTLKKSAKKAVFAGFKYQP